MIEGISGIPLCSKAEDEEEWKNRRRGTISASVVSSCYPGVEGKKVGYQLPTELWVRLLNGIDPDRFDFRANQPNNLLRTGQLLQEFAEEEFLKRHPNFTRLSEACEVVFRSNEYDHLTATPDLVARDEDGEPVVVEVKTALNLGPWTFNGKWRLPEKVNIQVQQQLGVMGLKRAYVVCYPLVQDADGESVWISKEIAFNSLIWDENRKWAQAMLECVQQNTAPTFHPTYKNSPDYDLGVPSALAKISEADVVVADDKTAQLVAELKELQEQKRVLLAAYKAKQESLKGAFGIATSMRYQGKEIATYKGGGTYDRPALLDSAKRAGVDIADKSAAEIVAAYPKLVDGAYADHNSRRLNLK